MTSLTCPPSRFLAPSRRRLRPGNTAHGTEGRNSLCGPPFKQWDLALYKDTAINERLKMQFRADFFNIVNHPNFTNPFLPTFFAACDTNGIDRERCVRGLPAHHRHGRRGRRQSLHRGRRSTRNPVGVEVLVLMRDPALRHRVAPILRSAPARHCRAKKNEQPLRGERSPVCRRAGEGSLARPRLFSGPLTRIVHRGEGVVEPPHSKVPSARETSYKLAFERHGLRWTEHCK